MFGQQLVDVIVPAVGVDDFLGPLGLTVVLLVIGAYIGRAIIKFFWQLWQLHVDGDAKRDLALATLTASVPVMAKSLEQLSSVVESWSEKQS